VMDNLVRLPDNLEQPEQPDLASTPKTLDLDIDPPVEFQRKRFDVLHLQEPTGGQLEKAEQELAGGPNAYTLRRYMITLVAAVAKVPREVVLAMRQSQIEAAFDFLSRSRPGGPPTGET
jgi:hypothetical protein